MGKIRGRQISDADFVSEDELGAGHKDTDIGEEHGFTGIFPVSVSSTTSSTQEIVCGGARFETWQVQEGDIIEIVGGGAAGDYTVSSIAGQETLVTAQAIPDTTNEGDLTVYHPTGATQMGVRADLWNNITGANVQGALDQIDVELDGVETITASNLGTGVGVFDAKVSGDLQFKSLVEGSNKTTISGGANEITIDIVESEINTSGINNDANWVESATNLGSTWANVYKEQVGSDLKFRQIKQGSNKVNTATTPDYVEIDINPGNIQTSTLDNDANFLSNIGGESLYELLDVGGTSPSDNDLLAYNTGTSSWTNQTAEDAGIITGGMNESTTGEGVYFGQTGSTLSFRSITGAGAIGVFNDGAQIEVAVDQGQIDTSALNNDANFISGVEVQSEGTLVGERPAINFIEGSDISLSVSDDATGNRVDVEINATSSGGEINDGANLGTGEGVYAGKTGETLEFQSIRAGSPKVVVGSIDNEIYIDVVEKSHHQYIELSGGTQPALYDETERIHFISGTDIDVTVATSGSDPNVTNVTVDSTAGNNGIYTGRGTKWHRRIQVGEGYATNGVTEFNNTACIPLINDRDEWLHQLPPFENRIEEEGGPVTMRYWFTTEAPVDDRDVVGFGHVQNGTVVGEVVPDASNSQLITMGFGASLPSGVLYVIEVTLDNTILNNKVFHSAELILDQGETSIPGSIYILRADMTYDGMWFEETEL